MEKIRKRLKGNRIIHSIIAPPLKVLRPLKRPGSFSIYIPGWVVKQREKLFSSYGKDEIVLNFGAGNRPKSGNVINMDILPAKTVDVAADGHRLPFRDGSIDLISSQGVFEHIREPWKVADEFYRILKPGGKIYTEAPFVCRFHPAARDYWRFTHQGFEVLFRDFEKIATGICSGPASAFSDILRHFLALLFSFYSHSLYNVLYYYVFGYLTFFIKYLDFFLIKNRDSSLIAYGFYYICRKRHT